MQKINNDLSAQWHLLHQQLTQKQQEIIHEIRHYPPPIPACDAQYNYLLELRTAIRHELRQVNALQQQLHGADAQTALTTFIQRSQFVESR